MSKQLPILLLVLVTEANVAGQSSESAREPAASLQFGDPEVQASHIEPGTARFLLFRVHQGIRQPVSLLERTIRAERRSERPVLIVEQRYESAGGVNTDTSVVAEQSLQPLTYGAEFADETQEFEFHASEARGRVTKGEGPAEVLTVPLRDSTFNAVVLDDLIRSLPWAEGRSHRFRAYNPGRQVLEVTARATGTETIRTAGGPIETWIVTLTGTPVPTVLWIAVESRELLRKRSELPNGDEFWQVRLY